MIVDGQWLDGKGLGYLVDPLDDRDFLARERALRGARRDIPDRVSHKDRMGPTLDQGDEPSCVPHGIAVVRTFDERRDHRRTYLWQPSELYGRCKQRDGIPHLPGTYPRVALDLTLHEGIGRAGKDYDRSAPHYRIKSYQRLLTIEEMERAIADRPIVLGLTWYEEWHWRVTGTFPPPGQDAGGHLLAVSGYDRQARVFELFQSWGEEAHDGGIVYIRYGEVDRQLALPSWQSADAWLMTDVTHGRS